MSSKIKHFLFPKPSLNHLLFLVFFVSSIVKQFIFKDIKNKDNLSIPIFKLYIYDIGDFISLIPYLIIKIKTKSQISNEQNTNRDSKAEDINYIYNDSKKSEFKKNKLTIFLNMFFITILDFIAQISTVIYYLIEGKQNFQVKHGNMNSILIFNVIFLFLFSRLLLPITFNRHHFFSLIIFIICLIVIVILDFIQIKNDSGDNFIKSLIYLSIKIFAIILYSLEDALANVMFLNYYFSPYFLLLMKAIVQFFYLIIFSIPFFFIKFKDEHGEEMLIFSMFKGIFEDKIYILYYSIYLINSFFYNILNFIIIDKFSANHSAISRIFENLGIFIINAIQKDMEFDYHFGVRIIMYILLIIASFIFNEFLVINLCGLANDTKLFLDYKENIDFKLIHQITINDDLTDDNNNDNNS